MNPNNDGSAMQVGASQREQVGMDADLLLMCDAEAITIEAAADESPAESAARLPRFTMVAYTGGPIRLAGWRYPVVVDLAGLVIPSQRRPIRFNHDMAGGVGHTEEIRIENERLVAVGVISRATPSAHEIVVSSKNGFPWQSSIAAAVHETEFIKESQAVLVNGRKLTGPLHVVRKATLGEISFVDLGADDQTSALVAAAVRDSCFQKESVMEKGEAIHEAAATTSAPDAVNEFRLQAAAESRRIAAIRRVCSGRHPDIEAQAIEEGWDETKTELAVLRAERPRAGSSSAASPAADTAVLEAAIRLGGQESEQVLLAQYGAQTLERAHPLRKIGLRKLIDTCCQIEGREAPGISASESEVVRAAFSTVSLPGVLSNVATKTMLSAYVAVPGVAKTLARKLSVGDFKQHTGYRLTGDFTMQEVGADGELKHAMLGEASFTYQAKTYGRMFGLTRRDFVNDDLGAFLEVPRLLGRGAALALEEAFWTLVLANTGNFFSTGNKNYIAGATTVLGPDGLEQAVQKFLEQTDADGKPIVLNPRWLLVPPSLKVTADQLFKSPVFNTGGSSTAAKVPSANTFAGLYEPLVSPYLSNTAFAGSSATAWYLWGDPADVAAFGICYLDGNEAPTIEEAPAAPNILGQGWRGYFDFGVCQIDPRGAVKSKGAA